MALPRWMIGWDVFCWMGQRRFARHWSVPQLRAEMLDSFAIVLSEDAIEDYLQRYQCMLAARQQDFALLKTDYATARKVVLWIEGLQPEKGYGRFTWCAKWVVSVSGSHNLFCPARPAKFAR